MDATAVTVQITLILIVFIVFYLTLVRPQQIKLRRHQELLDSLRPGDRVSTNGGLVGLITDTSDDRVVTMEIAPGVAVAVTRKGIDDLWPMSDLQNASEDEQERYPSIA